MSNLSINAWALNQVYLSPLGYRVPNLGAQEAVFNVIATYLGNSIAQLYTLVLFHY